MRINKIFMAIIVVLLAGSIPVFAQVQAADEIETPMPQFQDHGGVTPWFWIGLKTVFGAGYNIETTAGGFRNYGGDNHTYASFNLAFVDSHYQTPKFYEVPRDLDPEAWTGHFYMLNFTSRINSWEGGQTGIENNAPAWLAEITGKGLHLGFFTQAGNLIGGLYDSKRNSATSPKPMTRITGGNKVLNLDINQLGRIYYERDSGFPTSTIYETNSETEGGLWFIGYEKRGLFDVYLTMLSQGDVNSDVSDEKNKGFAGAVDFTVTPFGFFTDEQNPITFGVTGNVIAGFMWHEDSTPGKRKENAGFGVKLDGGFWLMENLVLEPIAAFDGRIDTDNEFYYRVGGGLTFRFSGMKWAEDEWGDLFNPGLTHARTGAGTMNDFANIRYENNKVLKYAYAQVYAATVPYTDPGTKRLSRDGDDDVHMLFRIEEPDGNLGFHEKLGAMAEMRLYNLLGANNADTKWEMQARVSWDFNIKSYIITPYLRGYVNDESMVKLRLGAYANIIPFTGFELAYTSANLNDAYEGTVPAFASNNSYERIADAGRIEFLVVIKSDDIRPKVPKRMSDWNYPAVIQDY